jgi:hypothetical protein
MTKQPDNYRAAGRFSPVAVDPLLDGVPSEPVTVDVSTERDTRWLHDDSDEREIFDPFEASEDELDERLAELRAKNEEDETRERRYASD